MKRRKSMMRGVERERESRLEAKDAAMEKKHKITRDRDHLHLVPHVVVSSCTINVKAYVLRVFERWPDLSLCEEKCHLHENQENYTFWNKRKKKAKKVLGPERPSFLDGETDLSLGFLLKDRVVGIADTRRAQFVIGEAGSEDGNETTPTYNFWFVKEADGDGGFAVQTYAK